MAGAVVFAAAFAGFEVLGNYVGGDVHRLVLVPIEEVGEMIGGTLFLWGAYALVKALGFVVFAPAEHGRDVGPAVPPGPERPRSP